MGGVVAAESLRRSLIDTLLTVDHLTKTFGRRCVLSDVSFTVYTGEVLGLIGPNVGNWSIVDDGGTKVLGVDGRQWLRGQPAGGLAQNARAIYGSRHEEFIDNVKAFAYFPYAVAKDVDDFHDGTISMRFKLVAGQLDSCAGILFNLKPNGDYLTVRFNGKEDNVVLWTFLKGKRSFVKKGTENVPLQMNTWHTLEISVKGTNLQASLDGKHLLDYTLAEPVSGRVGVWSKTDSVSYFDQYTVTKW